jgi:hypothetical protein
MIKKINHRYNNEFLALEPNILKKQLMLYAGNLIFNKKLKNPQNPKKPKKTQNPGCFAFSSPVQNKREER